MTSFSHLSMRAAPPRGQRGVVLMVALIVLVALTLAGLSMARTTDTGVVVAGNLAFRQTASQALDTGVEAAVAAIPSDIALSDQTVNSKYYPYMLALDADGLPAGIAWKGAGQPAAAYTIADPGGLNGYTVRYVVERMCFLGGGAIAGLDPKSREARCNMEDQAPGAQSNKIGSADLGSFSKINYRITVKVEGPRGTETFASAVISK
jgi:type IV pilus assembly protein PilX